MVQAREIELVLKRKKNPLLALKFLQTIL
jgi:hypothetical protein